jgi:hypothetical protein
MVADKPIQLNNGNDINWSFRVGISDLMEDVKFIGGLRFGQNLADKDALFSFQNLRKRVDWGVTYYRSTISNFFLQVDMKINCSPICIKEM